MIELRNVKKGFEGKSVLNGINLTIKTGEVFLLIGRSGAGKSVLLKNIMGLMKPESGQILIDGKDICSLDEKERSKVRLQFGLVFQGAALFDFLTVAQNVGFYYDQHGGLSESKLQKKISQTLSLVGLEGIENAYPYQLSGGMKKRVAIARAIIYSPKVLIYDEPTTGVDPIAVDKIISLITELNNSLGITSLVVTHDLEAGLKIAHRLGFLLGGKIIFEGTKDDLAATKDQRLLQFLHGSSAGPIKEMEV
jgi:phospholipid/cholesterol/gamma-HCH transport system ATP-binding protein